jgi:hypothetical protein
MREDRMILTGVVACLLAACATSSWMSKRFDPLRQARATWGTVNNREAVIPVQCYTKTDGISNPCWTCHTERHAHNQMDDWALQEEYAFSDQGMTNHWTNLFVDRRPIMAAMSESEVLRYVREDNYSRLRAALTERADYAGWRPDLDLRRGFDAEGYAKDGSWWRAFRYKPFLGTFWPTNGSTDDVFIRLPWPFYTDSAGVASRELYRINLAILEASLTVDDRIADAEIRRRVEPVDEGLAGIDLDADGRIGGLIDEIVGLPARYAGAASKIPVQRHLYPAGTEFLHSVRYLDPDHPDMIAMRMKELRYSVKRAWTDDLLLDLAYTEEKDHKERGLLPLFPGEPDQGLLNEFGWQLQGFIEDAEGRLRAQTHEETYYCMGCHGTIGVTVDQTFGFPRKVPGAAGWGYQSLEDIADVPQAGHPDPEILTWFRRVGGGDEFRENTEILDRFFPGGALDGARVRRAAPGGDRDIRWLIVPSRERALDLNRAYLALVREQSFASGRDAVLAPARNVHRKIDNGSTGFEVNGGVYRDGRLFLQWSQE